LAKGQSGALSLVTTSASIFGYTPNYAPLEQIQGLGTDARSDIYALSATLYHLMTGVKPPDALTRAAALVNGQPDPLAPAHGVAGGIGPEVGGVLARAMSQNREQRYPTAAGMRAALNGSAEVSTLVGKTEAATVIFERPATTLTDPSNAQTALKAGDTTVVRSQSETDKKRVAPWAVAVAALVLIGVLFGGFYAFQRRNNHVATAPPSSPEPGNANTPESSPAPVMDQASTQPSPAASSEANKVVVSNHPTPTNELLKKNKKAAKNIEKAAEKRATAPTVLVPNADEAEPYLKTVPNMPDTPAPNKVWPDARDFRRFGATTVRNLPDGTQIMTLSDGTRVVTMPNGTKRVYTPGQKLPRRRRLR
jgi:hypothetical protein